MTTIDIAVSVKSQAPKISKIQHRRLMERIKHGATCAEIGRLCSELRREFHLSVIADLPADRYDQALTFIDEQKRSSDERIKECLQLLEKDMTELTNWAGQIRDTLKVIHTLA